MRLLIAYDGSPAARASIAAAGALFAPCDAVVLTVREPALQNLPGAMGRIRLPEEVVDRGLAEIERQAAARASALVDEGVRLVTAAGIDATAAVEAGVRPWHTIDAHARRLDADVVVCGTNGRGPVGRAMLGSTASALLHRAPAPLLAVPAACGVLTGPVLVGYDGSPSARRAVGFVAAHLRGREALVACVWRSPVRHSMDARLMHALPSDTLRRFVEEIDDMYAEDALARAEEGAAELRAAGVDAEAHAEESFDTPWRPLIRLAHVSGARLIVTGSDRHDAGGAALGSVSSGLVHHAATALLLVPHEVATRAPTGDGERTAIGSAA